MDKSCDGLFLSPIVKARFSMKDELLYFHEYNGLIPSGHELLNITYCEAKNISIDSFLTNSKAVLTLEFDLLIIYEFCCMGNKAIEYSFLKDRIRWKKDINIKSYSVMAEKFDIDNMKCKNIIRQIWYATDIDLSCRKIVVGVHGTIDSLLYQEGIIKLEESPMYWVNQNQGAQINYRLPQIPISVDNEPSIGVVPNGEQFANDIPFIDGDSLNMYINQLGSLVKKATEINEKNIELNREVKDKSKRISYAEYRLGQLEDECDELKENLKSKNSTIEELRLKLEKAEKKAALLQNANLVMNDEIKVLSKENEDLKAYIKEEEEKKKKRLDYRIKSAISNLKIFNI